MFPLKEPSAYNPKAPVLTDVEVAFMKNDNIIKENMKKSLAVMMDFYEISNGSFASVPATRPWWATLYNHNYKRITRMLKSLKLAGLDKEANMLFQILSNIYIKYEYTIGKETFGYWKDAVK